MNLFNKCMFFLNLFYVLLLFIRKLLYIIGSMYNVLGNLRSKQAVVVSKRTKQLDTGLV